MLQWLWVQQQNIVVSWTELETVLRLLVGEIIMITYIAGGLNALVIYIYCLIAVDQMAKQAKMDVNWLTCCSSSFSQILRLTSSSYNDWNRGSNSFRHFYFSLCYQKQNTASICRQRHQRCLTVFYTNSNFIMISLCIFKSSSTCSFRSSSVWGIHIQISY